MPLKVNLIVVCRELKQNQIMVYEGCKTFAGECQNMYNNT